MAETSRWRGGPYGFSSVINHGASFGLGAQAMATVPRWIVAFVGMILLGIWAVPATGRAERFGAALAAAGAAGNLVDRLVRAPAPLHGGVVDWLHVLFYGPTFNLADIWLRGGLRYRPLVGGCGDTGLAPPGFSGRVHRLHPGR